eukprot:gene23582-29809_t
MFNLRQLAGVAPVGDAAGDDGGLHLAGQLVAEEGGVLALAGQRAAVHGPAHRRVEDADVGSAAYAQLACAQAVQPGYPRGVGAADRMIELLLAGAWAGLVINPINTRWTAAEVAYALGDCGASALAVDDGLMATAQAMTDALPALRHRIYIGEAQAPDGYLCLEEKAAAASPMEDVRSAPDTLAAIVYTGGTTGFPKGVMLSHGNLWASLVGRMAEVPTPPHYITLLISPMFHVAGLGRMLGQTIVGGTCVTVPVFQPRQVVDTMARERVSDLAIVPSMLQMLLDTEGFNPQHLPQLERILWGAAPITLPLLERGLAAFPQVQFVHAYGMTETAASVSVLQISPELDQHCRGQISAFKCPKTYEFRDKLPLTAAGKVQKTELRKSVAKGSAA